MTPSKPNPFCHPGPRAGNQSVTHWMPDQVRHDISVDTHPLVYPYICIPIYLSSCKPVYLKPKRALPRWLFMQNEPIFKKCLFSLNLHQRSAYGDFTYVPLRHNEPKRTHSKTGARWRKPPDKAFLICIFCRKRDNKADYFVT